MVQWVQCITWQMVIRRFQKSDSMFFAMERFCNWITLESYRGGDGKALKGKNYVLKIKDSRNVFKLLLTLLHKVDQAQFFLMS